MQDALAWFTRIWWAGNVLTPRMDVRPRMCLTPCSLAVLFLAVIEHLLHRPVPALGCFWVGHQGSCPWIVPLDVPLDYISRVSFQGHTLVRDHTHRTISMTGCQHGAGGFRPWGPPMQGGALLRSTGPQRPSPPPQAGGPPVAGTRPAAPDLPLPNPDDCMLLPPLPAAGAVPADARTRCGAAPPGGGLGHDSTEQRRPCPCEGGGPASANLVSMVLLVGMCWYIT